MATLAEAEVNYERMGRDAAAAWLRRHGWLEPEPCALWDEKTSMQRRLAAAYRRGYFSVVPA